MWRSDGTEEGTFVVKDIYPGGYDSNPMFLTAGQDVLYFIANDGVHGEALWSSDGTKEGTLLVKDFIPGTGSALPRNLTAVNDILFFYLNDGVHGDELWSSDGTEEGTVLVKDIYPGEDDSYYYYNEYPFIAYKNQLFFIANDGIHGNELWSSDGTADGTVLVKDIYPGINEAFDYYDASLTIPMTSSSFRQWIRHMGENYGEVMVRKMAPCWLKTFTPMATLRPSHLTTVNNTPFYCQ